MFIWPRSSAEGFEPAPSFDNACAELGGHLPIKVKSEFDELTGDRAEALLHNAALDEDTATKVQMFLSQI